MVKIISERPRRGKVTEKVFSSGGAVFNPEGKILLLKRRDEGIWCLPKGKVEKEEEMEEAASREIKEETNLSCKILSNILEIKYKYYWPKDDLNYHKKVRYYLAKASSNAVKLEKTFEEYVWCDEKEALKLLYYDNDKRVVKMAFRSMRKHY